MKTLSILIMVAGIAIMTYSSQFPKYKHAQTEMGELTSLSTGVTRQAEVIVGWTTNQTDLLYWGGMTLLVGLVMLWLSIKGWGNITSPRSKWRLQLFGFASLVTVIAATFFECYLTLGLCAVGNRPGQYLVGLIIASPALVGIPSTILAVFCAEGYRLSTPLRLVFKTTPNLLLVFMIVCSVALSLQFVEDGSALVVPMMWWVYILWSMMASRAKDELDRKDARRSNRLIIEG